MTIFGNLMNRFSLSSQQPAPPTLEELKANTQKACTQLEYANTVNQVLAHIVSSALTAGEFKQENIIPTDVQDLPQRGISQLTKILPEYNDYHSAIRERIEALSWPNFVAAYIAEEHIQTPIKALDINSLSAEELEAEKAKHFENAIENMKTVNNTWYQQILSYFDETEKTMPATLLIDIVQTAQETGIEKTTLFPQWFTQTRANIPDDRYRAYLSLTR